MSLLGTFMQGFFAQLQLADTLPILLAQLTVGVLLCFYGRDTLRFFAGAVGFLVGMAAVLLAFEQTPFGPWLFVGGVLFGGAGAAAAALTRKGAAAVVSGACGLMVGGLFFASASPDVLFLGALLGGFFGLLTGEKGISVITATGGAWLSAVAAAGLLSQLLPFWQKEIWFWFALSLALSLTQLGLKGQLLKTSSARLGARAAVKE